MKSNKYLITKLGMLCVALAPIFTNYVFIGQFSIGDLLVLISLILILNKIDFNQKFFYLYLFLILIIVAVSFFIFSNEYFLPSSFSRAAFYLIIISFYLSLNFEQYEILLIIYQKICFIVSIILLIQCTLYYGFHFPTTFQLPFQTYEDSALELMDVANGEFRPSALFREPSYFALYYIPILFIDQAKELWRKFIYDMFIIVLSTSSLGFIYGVIALLILYLKKITRTKVLVILLLSPLFGYLVMSLINSNILLLNRTSEILAGGGSLEGRFLTSAHLLGQASFFADSNFAERIFVYKSEWEWFNSIIYLLANFGYIILLPFLLIFRKIGLKATLLIIPILGVTHAITSVYFTLILILFYFNSVYNGKVRLKVRLIKGN